MYYCLTKMCHGHIILRVFNQLYIKVCRYLIPILTQFVPATTGGRCDYLGKDHYYTSATKNDTNNIQPAAAQLDSSAENKMDDLNNNDSIAIMAMKKRIARTTTTRGCGDCTDSSTRRRRGGQNINKL